jgi:hypothetical protein
VIAKPPRWGEDGWPRRLASACHGQRDRRTGEVSVLVHGPSVEQPRVEQPQQGEQPMDLAMLAAGDHEPAALGREPCARVDEDVDTGRVHERNLGQIQNERTPSTLENRQEDLVQDGRRREVELPACAENRGLLPVFFVDVQAHRE